MVEEGLVKVTSKELFEKVRKDIPFIPGAWVEFWSDLSGDTPEKLAKFKDPTDQGYESIITLVADWNFADLEGKKLPVTTESMRKLSLKLQRWISDCVGEVMEDLTAKKKESSET